MIVPEEAGMAGDDTTLGRFGRDCSDWPASIMSPTRNSAVARLCKPGTKGAVVSTRLTDRQIMGRYGETRSDGALDGEATQSPAGLGRGPGRRLSRDLAGGH